MSSPSPQAIELKPEPASAAERPGELSPEEAARIALGDRPDSRDTLRRILEAEAKAAAERPAWRPLHRLIGLIAGGPTDVAERHSLYAADGPGE